MDLGRVAEYGSPSELLAKPDGIFAGMYRVSLEDERN